MKNLLDQVLLVLLGCFLGVMGVVVLASLASEILNHQSPNNQAGYSNPADSRPATIVSK